ncbi:MAG: Mur ligase family protein [Actinomycetales bacterium]|nr:MAG: Mur ligase family protein [Actinomycetales bacterium]
MRLAVSLALAKLVGYLSRKLLHKSGETIPGKVLLTIYPRALAVLAKGRKIVLVSGTNGKTSTTKALAQVVSQLGTTVSNKTGSNLDRASATTLMSPSQYAVLEVDELYLPKLVAETQPRVVLLLNLSRDQLHRMHEVKKVAARWKAAVDAAPDTTFVGDIDDPFIGYALTNAVKSVRVSFGGRRHGDGAVCPACGKYLKWVGSNYSCSCGLTNKNFDLERRTGSAAFRNAELANIAGAVLGAPPISFAPSFLERVIERKVSQIDCSIRLVKNPASWSEALTSVKGQNVVLILNARQVDGLDTSWLWDISFESLRGKNVAVCGERAIDMAYRLHVAGIESRLESDLPGALTHFNGADSVEVLAAYTAFFKLVSS